MVKIEDPYTVGMASNHMHGMVHNSKLALTRSVLKDTTWNRQGILAPPHTMLLSFPPPSAVEGIKHDYGPPLQVKNDSSPKWQK